MFKKFLLVTSLFLMLILLSSCGSRMPFDPRLYNSSSSSVDNTGGLVVEPDIEIEMGDTNPFEDYNNPNENFASAGMSSWAFRGIFAENNTPTFWYDKSGANWEISDTTKDEYKESGAPNSEGGGYTIWSMVYYKYDGNNPFFGLNSSYNTGEHGEGIERFIFYRFTGYGGLSDGFGGANLDNMLVAVDTYTKLVFCFGVPTKFDSILGNENPTEWGSLDSRNGGMYKFYEYDPAGIVHEDGTIELYDWYTTAMGNGIYEPSAPALPTGREVATYGKAGRSPYYSELDDSIAFYTLSTRAVSLENLNMKSMKRSLIYGSSYSEQQEAYLVYDIRSAVYPSSSEPGYETLSHQNYGVKPEPLVDIFGATAYTSALDTIKIGTPREFTDDAIRTPMSSLNIEEIILEFDATITKYGSKNTATGYMLSDDASHVATYNDYGNPKIVFTYDKTQEAFVYNAGLSVLGNTTVSGDTTIKIGSGSKYITVNYNDESEIVYVVEITED